MNCATHNDQAAVAFCRTCGKPLCNNCTRDVRGVVYCEACLAARMEGAASASPSAPVAGFAPVQTTYAPAVPGAGPRALGSGPNPAVAGILAGFFPFGVGAVYCSQYAKGLAHLVIMVLLIAGVSSNIPDYMYPFFGLGIAFFYVYQIIDAIRSAKAIQLGEPPPDPFGLSQAFGTGERFEGAKVPTGAAILIGLGVLFLLHTAGILEMGMGLFVALILLALGIWLFAKHWGLIGRSNICYCERCRTRRLMGPAILVTLGLLLLLHSISRVTFWQTWPAILLVIGLVKLIQSNASSAGHIGSIPAGTSAIPPMAPPPSAPGAPQSSQPPSSGEVNHV